MLKYFREDPEQARHADGRLTYASFSATLPGPRNPTCHVPRFFPHVENAGSVLLHVGLRRSVSGWPLSCAARRRHLEPSIWFPRDVWKLLLCKYPCHHLSEAPAACLCCSQRRPLITGIIAKSTPWTIKEAAPSRLVWPIHIRSADHHRHTNKVYKTVARQIQDSTAISIIHIPPCPPTSPSLLELPRESALHSPKPSSKKVDVSPWSTFTGRRGMRTGIL